MTALTVINASLGSTVESSATAYGGTNSQVVKITGLLAHKKYLIVSHALFVGASVSVPVSMRMEAETIASGAVAVAYSRKLGWYKKQRLL